MQNIIYKITAPIIIIVLIVIAVFSYQNYKSQKLQQQATLLYKLQDDFFFKNERLIKMLQYVEEDKPILIENGGEFTTYDIDNYIGFFELLGKYNDDNVLPFDWIDNQFGYYISRAFNNAEIEDYIAKLRLKPQLNEAYFDFEKLAKRTIVKK
jgi:hypothetical protein